MIKNERRSARFVIGVLLVTLFALMCIVPLIYMILVSFADTTTMYIKWEDVDLLDFSNYIYLFENREFGRPILNSLIVVVISVIVVDIVSCTMAYGFEKKPVPGKGPLFNLVLATMMIPTQVTMIPLFIIMNRLGLIDSYASVILPSIFKPFAVFMLVQQMKSIPNDYLDAARVDGAGIFHVYGRIALPLCAPTLATLAVTTFMESWNDYLWPLLMLNDRNKMTLPIALSTLNGQYNTEYNVLMAGSLISMIPIIIIYLCAQKQFKNGLMAGGIKG